MQPQAGPQPIPSLVIQPPAGSRTSAEHSIEQIATVSQQQITVRQPQISDLSVIQGDTAATPR
jgi:hypothetical protein